MLWNRGYAVPLVAANGDPARAVALASMLALMVGAYGYFFDHEILKRVGLGSLVTEPTPPPPPETATASDDSGALVKCVDSEGHVTFTNHPCPQGERSK